tara:strand:- start:1887 stop:2894 length:1008 start_codon:yes stop_codon:yes gene_type:complete
MPDATALSMARTDSHKCHTVIPGSEFAQAADGHWVAHISHEHDAATQHLAGASPALLSAKNGYNATTISNVHVAGDTNGTVGVSFYHEDKDGKLLPKELHPGAPDARVHVAGSHGLTYQAVIPPGSTEPQTIHWNTHDYTAEQTANINALAPLDKPLKLPQTFEKPGERGVVYYRKTEEPCVAQTLFSQNPAVQKRLKEVEVNNGDATDGTYIVVPKGVHDDANQHVERITAAHAILSQKTKPGIAVHVVGSKRPDFVHLTIEHKRVNTRDQPGKLATPEIFRPTENGVTSEPAPGPVKLVPIGNTAIPSAPEPVAGGGAAPPLPVDDDDGGDDE